MFKSFIRGRLAAQERRLGSSLDYVRFMLDASLGGFRRFAKFLPMANYRKTLPVDIFHVARLVATQHADCGTCVQIEVDQARQDRVPTDVIRAALDGNYDELSQELIDVHRFTTSVVMAAGDEEPLRKTLQERYGDRGLVELALAIAACQVFPTVKRTLGYARSCALVDLKI